MGVDGLAQSSENEKTHKSKARTLRGIYNGKVDDENPNGEMKTG